MKILFVHQNFPSQYLHLARHMAAIPDNQVILRARNPSPLLNPTDYIAWTHRE